MLRLSLPRAILGALLALSAIAAGPASAGGFLVRENSAEATATAEAGNASRATGPDTVFANPAGMTRLQSDGFEVGAAVVALSNTFSGSARQATPTGAVSLPGNDGGDSGFTALIPSIYGVKRVMPDVSIGIAITVPFGNSSVYDPGWVGRYLGTRTVASSADINPSIAWKIDDTWSVGAGFSAQYLKLDVTQAIDQAAIFGAAVPDAFLHFKAHDWSYGFNAGVLADFGETRVGLTYRSNVNHRLSGMLDFSGASPLLGMVNGPANAKARLPSTTTLSVTSEVAPDITLSADIQFSHWSLFKDVTILSQSNPPLVNVQGYRDAWMIAVGGSYRLDERWSLKAGFAFDESPVTSRYRAVTLPDTDRYLLGLGAEVKLSDTMTLVGAYGHSFAIKPNISGSINNTDPVTHSVTLNGRYNVEVNFVAFSFRYAI